MPKLKKYIIALGTCLVVVLAAVFIYQKLHVSNVPSKDEIIKSFQDNMDAFLAIQKYAEETNGGLYACDNGRIMLIDLARKEKIDDASIKKDIIFVIKS